MAPAAVHPVAPPPRPAAPPGGGAPRARHATLEHAMAETAIDLFAPPRVVAEHRGDGALLLRSAEPLRDFAPSMAHAFRAGADAHPERMLATRAGVALRWGEA